MKNILLAAVGFVMLALGAMGLFLPLLPTTPFVLVAAACFAPIPALHTRVMGIPFVSEYIKNYKERTGISRKTVVTSLASLWVTLSVTAFLAKSLWLALLLAAVGAAVTTHIIMMSRPKARAGKPVDGQSKYLK